MVVSIDVYSVEGTMVTLKTQYTVDGNTLFLKQVFYETVQSWGSQASMNVIEMEAELRDGNIMYIGYLDDGTAYGEAYSAAYNVSVACKGMDVRKLLDIVVEMQFIE